MEGEYESVFSVGKFTCHMKIKANGNCKTEWSPEMPRPNSLNKFEIDQYRIGRNALLSLLAEDTGVTIAVVD